MHQSLAIGRRLQQWFHIASNYMTNTEGLSPTPAIQKYLDEWWCDYLMTEL